MSTINRYMTEAVAVESTTPPDTLPKGMYPAEVINAKVRVNRGTSPRTGQAYEIAETALQLRVTHGPAKGITTWVSPNLVLPEPSGDAAKDTQRVYFAQHNADALGLAKILDPNWTRKEVPHPTKTGKTITTFKGKMLTKKQLTAIADNEQDANSLATTLKTLKGVFSLDEKVTTRDGKTFTNQTVNGIEAYTEANIKAALNGHATTSSTKSAARTSSMYDANSN